MTHPVSEPVAPPWLTEEQKSSLNELVDDWHSWLFRQLDLYWPSWNDATDAALCAWVDQVLRAASPPPS